MRVLIDTNTLISSALSATDLSDELVLLLGKLNFPNSIVLEEDHRFVVTKINDGWFFYQRIGVDIILMSFVDDELRQVIFDYKYVTHTTFPNFMKKVLKYVYSGFVVNNNGFIFHSAAVDVNGVAILFSGRSGIGKSTQARLWEKYRKGLIINQDRPAVRRVSDGFRAYGLPWSGSEPCYCNHSAPISAIVFLEQGQLNHVEKMNESNSIHLVIEQCLSLCSSSILLTKLIMTIEELVKHVAIFKLICTPDINAVECLEAILEREREAVL